MDETREAVARAIRVIPQPYHEGRWIIAFEGGSLTGWSYPSEAEAQDALDKIRAALLPQSGSRFTVEGVEMMVVPVEPDEAMRLAGRTDLRSLFGESPCTADAADTYRAMLRACEEKGDG